MDSLPVPPSPSSFVLLAEHQSRTPASFYSGPPVLHYHSQRCKLLALERDLRSIPALSAIRGNANINGSAAEAESEKEIVVNDVDVWVTSDKFLLYVPSSSAGVSIPYPSISLHAIQRLRLPGSAEDAPEVQGLYMQIATNTAEGMLGNPEDDEEDENSIAITIVPPLDPAGNEGTSTAESSAVSAAERGIEDLTDNPEETPAQMFYAAVCACSNLHPDPGTDEEDGGPASSLFRSGLVGAGVGDGGLPPPVEGSSGWITAENMHEFFDEEGNWIAGGEEPTLPLGPGAGTVREREGEDGTEDQAGANEGGNEETKWRRTD